MSAHLNERLVVVGGGGVDLGASGCNQTSALSPRWQVREETSAAGLGGCRQAFGSLPRIAGNLSTAAGQLPLTFSLPSSNGGKLLTAPRMWIRDAFRGQQLTLILRKVS